MTNLMKTGWFIINMLSKILPSTTSRIKNNTPPGINAKIREDTLNNINLYKDSGTAIINDRIEALNREWDIERILTANAGAAVLIASLKCLRKSKWFLLTGAVGFFMLQHSLQGFCPPAPILRKLGVRTSEEIGSEKAVLKTARGDFSAGNVSAEEMLAAAEK